ncbi:30S ribosomal protein S13 [Wickerhamomyces ciferrii]|uniref:30S ribosomal protein S13 n=1 Tax=Wickerhamomyces ciferrii (strain ATCC 14091 / BCRC 22168 / CBS 111 / JCM 3599 / NBRC 0793 / NRRL Y-1031 F-60-10) TaxID=1206466 RepID=K0KJB8_WICCF|nr:30S ribosomal protein S13 [Wickerhamomyces ciferrii]CCH43071.1 30S ribosomal protein S13 [Wickerhamomyces ciferrii]
MVTHIMGKAFSAKQPVHIGLAAKFYGLGLAGAQKICAKLGLYPWMRMHQLSEQQILAVTKELSELTLEGNARAIVRENIQLKRRIGSYAGLRHAMGLPVRGQGTRNNAKTAKKLNRLERRGYSTLTRPEIPQQATGMFAAFKNLFRS